MFSDNISIPLRLLIKKLKILNVYQINSLQHLLFMSMVKSNIVPREFNQVFSTIVHVYPAGFSHDNIKIYELNLKLTNFAIGFGRPPIWNNFFYGKWKVLN